MLNKECQSLHHKSVKHWYFLIGNKIPHFYFLLESGICNKEPLKGVCSQRCNICGDEKALYKKAIFIVYGSVKLIAFASERWDRGFYVSQLYPPILNKSSLVRVPMHLKCTSLTRDTFPRLWSQVLCEWIINIIWSYFPLKLGQMILCTEKGFCGLISAIVCQDIFLGSYRPSDLQLIIQQICIVLDS